MPSAYPAQTAQQTQKAEFLNQVEAALRIGVSRAWLCVRRADPFYAPAIRLGETPRYHVEQVRLWLAVAAGNQTAEDAALEWSLIRGLIGKKVRA